MSDITKITELRAEILALRTKLDWFEERIPFVLAEEGFNDPEIDDLLEQLSPPIGNYP